MSLICTNLKVQKLTRMRNSCNLQYLSLNSTRFRTYTRFLGLDAQNELAENHSSVPDLIQKVHILINYVMKEFSTGKKYELQL